MARVSKPWLVATFCVIAVIWGNSLVPGEGSSGLSLAVLDAVQGFLRGFGLPWEWVTNFLIRKAAHFSEYAVLGMVACRALDPRYSGNRVTLTVLAALLVLTPAVDETIQLFSPGRSAQITDVALDCCGAACGVALSYTLIRWLRRRWGSRGEKDSQIS